jgi:hypothetical protein
MKGLPDQAELQDSAPNMTTSPIPMTKSDPRFRLAAPTVADSLAARSPAALEVVLMQLQPVIKKSA